MKITSQYQLDALQSIFLSWNMNIKVRVVFYIYSKHFLIFFYWKFASLTHRRGSRLLLSLSLQSWKISTNKGEGRRCLPHSSLSQPLERWEEWAAFPALTGSSQRDDGSIISIPVGQICREGPWALGSSRSPCTRWSLGSDTNPSWPSHWQSWSFALIFVWPSLWGYHSEGTLEGSYGRQGFYWTVGKEKLSVPAKAQLKTLLEFRKPQLVEWLLLSSQPPSF